MIGIRVNWFIASFDSYTPYSLQIIGLSTDYGQIFQTIKDPKKEVRSV